MRALLQRCLRGVVRVEGKEISSIGKGYVVFLGICRGDTEKEASFLVNKILTLRLFPHHDKEGHLSICDIGGELLVVSQFTLCAEVNKGRRPSFDLAMPAQEAKYLYEYCVELLKKSGLRVETGVFGAMMEVELVNWGPYTIWIES